MTPAKEKEHEPTAVKRDPSDQKIVEPDEVGPNPEEAAEIARKKGMAKGTAGAAETGSEYEQGAVGANKEDVEPLLTEDELKDLRSKFGSPIFLSVLYEKVKLATILLDNSKEYNLLMMSFDIGTDHQSIISNKILPMVKKGW